MACGNVSTLVPSGAAFAASTAADVEGRLFLRPPPPLPLPVDPELGREPKAATVGEAEGGGVGPGSDDNEPGGVPPGLEGLDGPGERGGTDPVSVLGSVLEAGWTIRATNGGGRAGEGEGEGETTVRGGTPNRDDDEAIARGEGRRGGGRGEGVGRGGMREGRG